ncbi:hypothetical protein Taro_026251, partial [Colocasia esculenta]|nr:hypothetical protein [Colocasia esculenta]
MNPARRASNGRSPLVRKQSQITSFFSPGKIPKESPIPASTPKTTSASPKNPNPNPSPSHSPDPTPPSKQKKPVLIVGHTPLSSFKAAEPGSAGKRWKEEVVGRRLKVWWPLDKAWYEGCVKSFDGATGKHVIQYDDAEEEVLDLGDEKIEWLEEEPPRSFRRLRRRISVSKSVLPADVSLEDENTGEESTEDDDWGEAAGEGMEDDSEDMEIEGEEDEEEGSENFLRRSRKRTAVSSKRKKEEADKVDSVKKARSNANVEKISQKFPIGGSGSMVLDVSITDIERKKALAKPHNTVTDDAVERFGKREVEKFGFLREGRKDAKRRRPGDVNYDPRTLYLPPDFLKSLSGGQRQWWEFKSKHMDKVLFFKMGKFYELFEMDAHIGVKELDLQYMKGEQPHCGFPEKNFSMDLERLVRKGYRVLVVEQTETPEQLELRRKKMGAKDKVVKREICAVVSKGTLTEGELLSTNADASCLLSLTEKCPTSEDKTVLGVCMVDVSTSKFMIGQFEDDCERQCLSSMLSELRPVEIIKPSKQLSPETERALQRHTRCPLVNELVPFTEFWDAVKTIDEVRNIYRLFKHQKISGCPGDGTSSTDVAGDSLYLPAVLSDLVSAGENGCYALSAFGGCLYYLRESLLDKSLLRCAKFELLPCSGITSMFQKRYMILDASALENLEILENRNGGFSGTLFSQLDHCVTAFGKRLLKGWLARPLYDVKSIVERQDAIACFK